ncbi:MAG: c-type cytochrome [Rhodospirillaceae bacterium]|nr:c-type cytochrome [Rhodospirillaceae bacterium]
MSTEPTKLSHSPKPDGFAVKAVGFIGATAAVAWGLSLVAIPVLQGQQEGLDWFTSICRAVGISTRPGGGEAKADGAVSLVTWSPSVLSRVAAGDARKGEELAKDTCTSCHNPNGLSTDPATMPSITGQPARALYKQLWDIKNGTRINDAMLPLVQPLTDTQVADLAAYYSSLNVRSFDIRLEPEASDATLKLINQGDAARALPGCRSCHDAPSGGPVDAPHLVGQYPAYVAAQLRAFAGGERRNDVAGRMRAIAAKLTPAEIESLARYYEGPR